jgi:hypothetical protein
LDSVQMTLWLKRIPCYKAGLQTQTQIMEQLSFSQDSGYANAP